MNTDPIAAEIKKGLPDDMIVWIDRPDLVRFIRTEISHSVGAMAIPGLLAGVIVFINMVLLGGFEKPAIGGLIVSTLVVCALVWIPVKVISSVTKAHRTVYAITNKRLVILMEPWLWLSKSVCYYTPDKISYLKQSSDNGGMGNLEFSREAHFSRDKRNHRWQVRYKKVGFWGIANVKMVEDTIRYQFHIQ